MGIFQTDCEEEGIPDQAKSMYKETIVINTGPVAPVWLKPNTSQNYREISKNLNLVRYSLLVYLFLGMFFSSF